MKTKQTQIEEFIGESNAIEGVYSEQAFDDAMEAWNYLKEKQFLTLEVILQTHYLLMQNLELGIAGKWRDCDVWIGGHRKIFISETLIKEDVKELLIISDKLLKWGKNENDEIKEKICKILHVGFEHIHGHCDGNGRTYRLIMNWQRMQLKLPILIVHADWEEKGRYGEQGTYYGWFKDGGNGLTEFIKKNNIK